MNTTLVAHKNDSWKAQKHQWNFTGFYNVKHDQVLSADKKRNIIGAVLQANDVKL